MSDVKMDPVAKSGLTPFRLLLLIAVVLLVLVRTVIVPLFFGRLRHVRGPWLNKITGLHLAFHDLRFRRKDAISEWHEKYGPVVCIAPNEVSVATVGATREIYGTSSRWDKSDYFDHFMGYDERSVFATKPYTAHRDKRKLIASFYQARTIYNSPDVIELLHDRMTAVLNYIETESTLDVYDLADWYAIDNITYLTMGPNQRTRCIETDGVEREIFQGLKHLQFWGPLRDHFPWLSNALSFGLPRLSAKWAFLHADDRLSSWCREKVSATIEYDSAVDGDFLIKRLLQARDEKDNGLLDPTYIAAEILDNIGAAEATVAVTSTYFIWRLTQNPQWQHRVRDELRALPVQSNGFRSFADINQCPIFEACLREVYRLNPATSGRSERVVPQGGHVLAGVYIPENTVVAASEVSLHRDGNVYPSGDNFAPEMWLTEDEASTKQREAHLMPFGYGQRICAGKALATIEIKVLVAEIILQYQTYLTPSTTLRSMQQSSTHDALPSGRQCVIEFRKIDNVET